MFNAVSFSCVEDTASAKQNNWLALCGLAPMIRQLEKVSCGSLFLFFGHRKVLMLNENAGL